MRTDGLFSAARRACSLISFLLLFLFIVLLEQASNCADVDDEIGQRSDDSEHLFPVDQRVE